MDFVKFKRCIPSVQLIVPAVDTYRYSDRVNEHSSDESKRYRTANTNRPVCKSSSFKLQQGMDACFQVQFNKGPMLKTPDVVFGPVDGPFVPNLFSAR